jgi:hypothetical protein
MGSPGESGGQSPLSEPSTTDFTLIAICKPFANGSFMPVLITDINPLIIYYSSQRCIGCRMAKKGKEAWLKTEQRADTNAKGVTTDS